jgi:hypothetical protein
LESQFLQEELESFFIGWANRIPQKSLSLNVSARYYIKSFDNSAENKEIIDKYIKLGVIKKFHHYNTINILICN